MPTLRLPNGSSIEFDNVAELAEYQRLLDGQKHTAAPSSKAQPGTSGDTWIKLMRELRGAQQGNQRTIITLVKAAGESGISRADLAKKLDMNEQGIGGAIGGVTKACRRAGLESLADIIESEGGAYSPGPLLRAHDIPKEFKMTK
jgi:hypothetical protein